MDLVPEADLTGEDNLDVEELVEVEETEREGPAALLPTEGRIPPLVGAWSLGDCPWGPVGRGPDVLGADPARVTRVRPGPSMRGFFMEGPDGPNGPPMPGPPCL